MLVWDMLAGLSDYTDPVAPADPLPNTNNHPLTHHPQGECKFTITDEGHSEWVSCVRFSPSPTAPVIVSCGWDKKVKVRNLAWMTCVLTPPA